MVSAIGSSTFYNPAAGASAAGLEAQLARYQKVLSECVSCDSAKTREGKQAIQDISSKISDVKARIEEISTTNEGVFAAQVQDNNLAATVSTSNSVNGAVGNRLNVFA